MMIVDFYVLEMPTIIEKLTPLGVSIHFQACTRYLISPGVRLMLFRGWCVVVNVVDVVWFGL